MSNRKYNITFETYTPESVEAGDSESAGMYAEGVDIRTAIEYIQQEIPSTTSWGGWAKSGRDWLTYQPGPDWTSEEHTEYSIHGPHIDWLARILGAT